MSDTEKTGVKSPSAPRPESPTTARPVDFDDDPEEPSTSTNSALQAPKALNSSEENPPPKPPRPMSPQQQAEATLKEAFPSIDVAVVKAVLHASGGQVEPAFNALLGMSDPDSVQEQPPPQPPRPAQSTSTGLSQVEADELYARQLAEHYGGTGHRAPPAQQRYQQQRRPSYDEEEREHNFFDDELPIIRDNLRKGFLDAQSNVNKWVQNFKKRLDGDDLDEINSEPPRQGYASQAYPPGRQPPRRSGDMTRRSADRDRYDADPRVLPDDFSTLELRDTEAPPSQPPRRPLANPDLFKPTPSPPGGSRKVSFQDDRRDDGSSDMYGVDAPKRPGSATKSSKWQPLSAVEPSPVAENDPFSVGDSDDDKDKKDQSADEAEKLQKATAEAMTGDIGLKDDPKLSTKS